MKILLVCLYTILRWVLYVLGVIACLVILVAITGTLSVIVPCGAIFWMGRDAMRGITSAWELWQSRR